MIFVEEGIGNGTTWGVNFSGPVRNATVNGPFGDLVLFIGPPGPYNSTVFVGPGYESDGGSAYNFSSMGPGGYSIFYLYFEAVTEVTFHEVGLPAGTNWSVGVGSDASNASTTGNIGFLIPDSTNWTFDVPAQGTFLPYPADGKFNATGTPIYLLIRFGLPYPVSFEETGLPPGEPWSVILNGTTRSSTSETIGFLEPNGTSYGFSVGSLVGYTATPSSGAFPVAGSPVSMKIAFSTLAVKPGPLEVRAWANQTSSGGDLSSCQNSNGSITTTGSEWEVWTFSAVAWNGTPPYNFSWRFPGDSSIYYGARVSMNYTYPQTPPASAEVTVTDSAGGSNSTTLLVPVPVVPVRSYPACPTLLGAAQTAIFALIAVAAVVILVVVTVTLARKKRKGGRNPTG